MRKKTNMFKKSHGKVRKIINNFLHSLTAKVSGYTIGTAKAHAIYIIKTDLYLKVPAIFLFISCKIYY
jgi:hypothetical protein